MHLQSNSARITVALHCGGRHIIAGDKIRSNAFFSRFFLRCSVSLLAYKRITAMSCTLLLYTITTMEKHKSSFCFLLYTPSKPLINEWCLGSECIARRVKFFLSRIGGYCFFPRVCRCSEQIWTHLFSLPIAHAFFEEGDIMFLDN